ncbi:MAG: DUF3108 domain-containing protein [Steroidobacteraceae bacterium]|nr:DUF3108 domain-containing protein [Steroidobacteraceae bacterium]MDW8258401.1 hypothetical protein [Gammaproteobacteria bacterium]
MIGRGAARSLWLAGAILAGCAYAQQTPSAAPHAATSQANTVGVPNPRSASETVRRWAKGRYLYTALQERRARGSEEFHLTVYADGSRSLLFWHDLFARHSQFTVALRVGADWRPQEAYVNYYSGGAFKGSAHLLVAGNRLSGSSRGPSGVVSHAVEVPERFSIGAHPVAADGWHTAHAPNPRQKVPIYTLEASADIGKPPLGRLTEVDCEFVGRETITVPAGTFETLRYRLAGANDIWIMPEDRIVVRMVSERLDRGYVLEEFYREDLTQLRPRS